MTTATLVVSRSQFTTAPHHAHFSGSTSTVTTGTLRDAQFEWWVQDLSDGSTVTSSFSGPEFGHVFDTPGSYRITFKLKGSGDVAWSEDSEDITVGTASYQAECWVDMDAGSDGVGTLADPFNVIASAVSYINTNWSAGATNQHAIHLKRATSQTLSAGFGTFSARGRLVIDAYGTGARPILDMNNGAFGLISSATNHGLAWNGIEIRGGATFPVTLGVPLMSVYQNEATGSDGLNFIMHDCVVSGARDVIYFIHDTTTPTTTGLAAGAYDFIAFSANTCSDSYSYYLAGMTVRYVLDTSTYGRSNSTFGRRLSGVQHGFIRSAQDQAHTSGVQLRIHSIGITPGADTQWLVLDACTILGGAWIEPSFVGSSDTPDDMRDVWICNSYLSGAAQGIDLFVNDGMVFRNNVVVNRGLFGSVVTYRNNGLNIDAGTNWLIEGNTLVHLEVGNSWGGNKGWAFQAYTSTVMTEVTFRNNLFVMPFLTGSPRCIGAGGSPVPSTLFAECDGNHLWCEDSVSWADGFSTGNGSLATWQGATTFDDNSSTATGANDPLTDSNGVPVDATLVAASAPIDAGVTAPGVYLDYAGHIRTGTMDVGAYSYGDSGEPTAPSTLPGTPTIYASTRTATSVTLSIVEGGDQDTYVVNYAVHPYDSEGDGWTVFNAALSGSATYVEVTGLDPETEYDFGVWGHNGSGDSAVVQETETTLPLNAVAAEITAPRDFAVVAGSPVYSSVVCSWRMCEDAECLIEGRDIATTTGFLGLAVSAPSDRTATITNLLPSRTYEFRARNVAGSSDTAQITTGSNSPPTAPSALTVTATTVNGATFTWTDNSNNETGFVVWIRDVVTLASTYHAAPPDATTLTVRTLIPGQTYIARITAVNSTTGNSAWVPALTLPGVLFSTRYQEEPGAGGETPDAPIAFSGYALGETSARLSWIDTATSEQGFRVRVYTSGGGLFRVYEFPPDLNDGTNTVTITGLYAGQTYTCYLAAFNAAGESVNEDGDSSSPATVTIITDTPVRPPATPPTSLAVNEIGAGTGLVTLDSSASNADVIHIWRDTIPATSEVELTAVLSPIATSFIDDTATPGADYTYWATAQQTGGDETAPSNTDTIVYSAPLDVPSVVPYAHTLVPMTNLLLLANWSTTGVEFASVRVEISSTSSTGPWVTADDAIPAGVTSHVIDDADGSPLVAETQYWTRVILVNSFGDSDPSNVATATTLSADSQAAPAGPTITSVQVMGPTVARVTFVANDDAAASYRARVSTGGAYSAFGPTIYPGENLILDLVGLDSATAYNVIVRATNATGTGDSEAVAFRTGSNGGTIGESARNGNERQYVRTFDKDAIDIDIDPPATKSVVNFVSQAPHAANGPHAALWIDGAIASPINLTTGECVMRERIVTGGTAMTIKITGTGTGESLYRLNIKPL